MFSVKTIYNYIKKTFTRRDFMIIFGIIFLYAITRLINLDKWPIFSDEGIYINWAHVAWKDAAWRFISVTDGRQPLQTWATIPFLKLFPQNFLFAGRLFSVSTGFVALTGTVSFMFYLWGKRAAFIGGLIYVFMPYFLFYDRMALVDSAVNAGFIWILFFSVLLIRERRLDIAFTLGFIGGFALLAKSSSRMFLMLSLFAPTLFLKTKNNNIRNIISKSINYWVLLGFAFGISLFFYNVQRLSPYFHYVGLKNNTFVMTFAEFIQTPFAYAHNFHRIPLYVAWESGWVIIPFSLLGMYKLYKKEIGLFVYLLIFLLLPYITIGLFAKILFGRYILFFGSLILIFATYFFQQYKPHKYLAIMLGFLILSMVYFDYQLMFNPVRANFPPVDRGQYVDGVTAVWGADDLMKYLQDKAKTKDILVLAEGNFGLIADVLKVYSKENDNVEIKGLWPLEEKNIYEYLPELKNRDVYVVFSHRQEIPSQWPIKLIKKYERPNGDKATSLYRYINNNE